MIFLLKILFMINNKALYIMLLKKELNINLFLSKMVNILQNKMNMHFLILIIIIQQYIFQQCQPNKKLFYL